MSCPVAARALEQASQQLRGACAVFHRTPTVDALFPRTSDVDLLVFGDVPDVLPERVWPGDASPAIDIIWLPAALLRRPEALATYGVMAHRMATSALLFDRDGGAAEAARLTAEAMTQPAIHAERIGGLLSLGGETTREIGATWDVPALGRFWLQIALSSVIVAACDSHGLWNPNAYTRPFDALGRLAEVEPALAARLHAALMDMLDLKGVDPLALEAPLRRLHRRASAAGAPDWPEGYRLDTQYEHAYYRSEAELDWRLDVAREMAEAGAGPQAALTLRFWAYSLARLPMVSRRVEDGVSVAFGRPWVPMGEDLRQHDPHLMDDLSFILGGATLPRPAVEARVAALHELRDAVVDSCQARNIPLKPLPLWVPTPHLSQRATPPAPTVETPTCL